MPDRFPSDFATLSKILNRVASEFGLDATLLDLPGGGFSDAAVFRIADCCGNVYASKCLPPSDTKLTLSTALKHRFISEVAPAAGVPIPVPRIRSSLLFADQNQSVPTLFQNSFGLWQIENWLPGISLTGDRLSDSQLSSAMVALAGFHRCAAAIASSYTWCGTDLGIRKCVPQSIRRRTEIVVELRAGLLDQLRSGFRQESDAEFREISEELWWWIRNWLPFVEKMLDEVGQISITCQPVIRDLWSAHVLFDKDTVSGMIDLGALATDHVTLDLARILRSWFPNAPDRIFRGLEIYSAHRPLTAPELKLVGVFDVCNVVLSPVTWLKRRYQENETARTNHPEVRNRLKEQAKLLKNLTPLTQLFPNRENI
ncbi:MAG: phosphotransferase [Planctomyces sp.]|nr:phosphotransferase [Planctomyces sp.]